MPWSHSAQADQANPVHLQVQVLSLGSKLAVSVCREQVVIRTAKTLCEFAIVWVERGTLQNKEETLKLRLKLCCSMFRKILAPGAT